MRAKYALLLFVLLMFAAAIWRFDLIGTTNSVPSAQAIASEHDRALEQIDQLSDAQQFEELSNNQEDPAEQAKAWELLQRIQNEGQQRQREKKLANESKIQNTLVEETDTSMLKPGPSLPNLEDDPVLCLFALLEHRIAVLAPETGRAGIYSNLRDGVTCVVTNNSRALIAAFGDVFLDGGEFTLTSFKALMLTHRGTDQQFDPQQASAYAVIKHYESLDPGWASRRLQSSDYLERFQALVFPQYEQPTQPQRELEQNVALLLQSWSRSMR
ncbi:MAG: hypothetical protein H6619_00305 [Deltaproteobacteria bacterium]|nr:hypothetical protein [Deltaproteobacteria bacterium]